MAGETTGTISNDPPFLAPNGMFLVPFSQAYASTDNETNDVKQFGYLPANCTVHGVIYSPTDMDSNVSPALVQKITVGSSDLFTGLTGGQTGAKTFVGCVPTRLTSNSLVTVTSTTAAATGASGTLYLAFVCQR